MLVKTFYKVVLSSHLHNVVTQPEDDNMLRPEIPCHIIHASRAVEVFERERMFAVQVLHDVLLEVLQQVHLALSVSGCSEMAKFLRCFPTMYSKYLYENG